MDKGIYTATALCILLTTETRAVWLPLAMSAHDVVTHSHASVTWLITAITIVQM